jgi:hypothetical protein
LLSEAQDWYSSGGSGNGGSGGSDGSGGSGSSGSGGGGSSGSGGRRTLRLAAKHFGLPYRLLHCDYYW